MDQIALERNFWALEIATARFAKTQSAIARELHDGVGQLLAAMSMNVAMLLLPGRRKRRHQHRIARFSADHLRTASLAE